jgi:hypothetical protein
VNEPRLERTYGAGACGVADDSTTSAASSRCSSSTAVFTPALRALNWPSSAAQPHVLGGDCDAPSSHWTTGCVFPDAFSAFRTPPNLSSSLGGFWKLEPLLSSLAPCALSKPTRPSLLVWGFCARARAPEQPVEKEQLCLR